MLRQMVGILVIISLGLLRITRGDIFEKCGDREGFYVASGESCSQYIFCYGEDSFVDECDDDTPYFSEYDQTCDADPNVCKTDVEESAGSPPPAIDDGNEDLNQPLMSEGPITSISSTKPAPITVPTLVTSGVSSSSTAVTFSPLAPTTATNLLSQCPSTDVAHKVVLLPDPKSCSDYFMCYHGEPVPMRCSSRLHFDHKSQKCDYPEKVKCQLNFASPRDTCHAYTVDFYPHATKCNYYYMCQFGYLMVMQCPLNMGWDYEKRTCVVRRNAKCYKPTWE